MNKLLSIIIFVISLNSQANIYRCSSPGADPDKESISLKITTVTTSEPFIKGYIEDDEVKEYLKRPFLIYYAVDSEEPFMQYSVKYENARLRKECENNKHVNFISFLNTDYKSPKSFFRVCKNQIYKELKYSDYPRLGKKLEFIRVAISQGDHTRRLPGDLMHLIHYKEENNRVFYNYPLSHPDFLNEVLQFVTNEKTLFPATQWTTFMNLKSHGSPEVVLSGLHECQLKAKVNQQKDSLKEVLTNAEIAFLESADFYRSTQRVEELLQRFNLGEQTLAQKLSNKPDFPTLEKPTLEKPTLGNVTGLGVDAGLGVDLTAGLYHYHLSSILARTYNSIDINTLGFLFLESCDSNRKMEQHQEYILGNLAIYSAKNSLWYRNINWWDHLSKHGQSSFDLINSLRDASSRVPNFEFSEAN